MLRIAQDLFELSGGAVDTHPAANRPDSVAIIDVPVHVTGVQRLDWLAVGVVPSEDCHALSVLRKLAGYDDILLDSRNEGTALDALELLLDDSVVLQER